MAKQGKVIRVNLVIEGPIEDIMDVVSMAMAGNLMKSYKVDEGYVPEITEEELFGAPRISRVFQEGDQVRAKGNDQRYDMKAGDIGVVTKVYYTGRKCKVRVRWDDNHEGDVGGSYIELVKVR